MNTKYKNALGRSGVVSLTLPIRIRGGRVALTLSARIRATTHLTYPTWIMSARYGTETQRDRHIIGHPILKKLMKLTLLFVLI